MEYFYTPPTNISNATLTIDGDEFSHLTRVMRKKLGDEIVVVDGAGAAYQTVITEITRRAATGEIHQRFPRLHEPVSDVTLAVGMLKNPSRFDFLVEKATELGVNRIVPLLTERTIPHHAKIERWQKLALAAMKQCGRCVLPKVEEPWEFAKFALTEAALKIIAHEKVTSPSLSEFVRGKQLSSVVICIGPEGGFSDDEIELAVQNTFHPFSLGMRRLRTETAAIAAVSLLGI